MNMLDSPSTEHAARVKAALEKGGWDTPLQWRKRKRRKPRNYQPRLPDPDPPEEKESMVDARERAPP